MKMKNKKWKNGAFFTETVINIHVERRADTFYRNVKGENCFGCFLVLAEHYRVHPHHSVYNQLLCLREADALLDFVFDELSPGRGRRSCCSDVPPMYIFSFFFLFYLFFIFILFYFPFPFLSFLFLYFFYIFSYFFSYFFIFFHIFLY